MKRQQFFFTCLYKRYHRNLIIARLCRLYWLLIVSNQNCWYQFGLNFKFFLIKFTQFEKIRLMHNCFPLWFPNLQIIFWHEKPVTFFLRFWNFVIHERHIPSLQLMKSKRKKILFAYDFLSIVFWTYFWFLKRFIPIEALTEAIKLIFSLLKWKLLT